MLARTIVSTKHFTSRPGPLFRYLHSSSLQEAAHYTLTVRFPRRELISIET